MFSLSLLISERKSFNILKTFFRCVDQNCNVHVHRNDLRTRVSTSINIMSFVFHFCFRTKFFGPLCRKTTRLSSKLHSTCPKQQFEEKTFSGRKNSFSIVFRPGSKKLRFWRKKINRVLETAFYVSSGTFCGKIT